MSKVILVVDDSASVRQVVGIALRGAGYTVVEACDGKDALVKLDAQSKVNLVISDVNMPNMDGISFVKEMKQKANYKFTPVIMLTTEGADDKKQEGKAAGAKAWIVKPFRPEQLLQTVAMLIS
jgi:two-component system, chemotaxis family, chemotaxis protein CheY